MPPAVLDAVGTGQLSVVPSYTQSNTSWEEAIAAALGFESHRRSNVTGTRFVEATDPDLVIIQGHGGYAVGQVKFQPRQGLQSGIYPMVVQPTPIFTNIRPHSSLRAFDDFLRSALLGLLSTPIPPLRTASVESGELPRVRNPIAAVEDLRNWLGVTNKDLQSVTGIPERTFYDWKRTKRVHRPSTVRKLWRAHALVDAVVKKLGVDGARQWFHSGAVSPLDLLQAGDLDAVEQAAHALLFRRDATEREERTDRFPFVPDADYIFRHESDTVPVVRANRRPRRRGSSET